jgi:hypothetical protein
MEVVAPRDQIACREEYLGFAVSVVVLVVVDEYAD